MALTPEQNRDEIIAMAREVIGDYSAQHYWPFFTEELFRFAALVAAKEREACAQIAEQTHPSDLSFIGGAIRARARSKP